MNGDAFSEAVPIGAGTHLDGKFFVWLRQKLLKSVRIPASFFLARQKFFLPICIPSPIGTASYGNFCGPCRGGNLPPVPPRPPDFPVGAAALGGPSPATTGLPIGRR